MQPYSGPAFEMCLAESLAFEKQIGKSQIFKI
jgi:hypothetical protein